MVGNCIGFDRALLCGYNFFESCILHRLQRLFFRLQDKTQFRNGLKFFLEKRIKTQIRYSPNNRKLYFQEE